MIYLPLESYKTKADFFTDLNKTRLANKGQWIAFSGLVGNAEVQCKTFGHSYLQIFKINGLHCAGGIDSKVGQWKKMILEALDRNVTDYE